MVVVKIEMWPRGQASKAYHLGTLTWVAEKKGGGVFKRGSIGGHRPKSRNQWGLLFRILRQMAGYRNLTGP